MNVYENNKNISFLSTEIVLVDIIGFSKLTSEEQANTAVLINGDLEFHLQIVSGQTTWTIDEMIMGFVSTGDGFYVVLQPHLIGYGIILAMSLRTSLLNASERNKNLFAGVRVACHYGELNIFQDFSGKTNYVGPVMNECARIVNIKDEELPENFCLDKNIVAASVRSLKEFCKLYSWEYFKERGVTRSQKVIVTDKHNEQHEAVLIESPRRLAFNPPKPIDYLSRLEKRRTKYS